MSRSEDSPGSHPLFRRSELFHFGTEKKDNVAVSSGSSVTASLVGSVAVFNTCGNRCEVAGTALTGKIIAPEL